MLSFIHKYPKKSSYLLSLRMVGFGHETGLAIRVLSVGFWLKPAILKF